ncbi:MAG TPA: DNA translocase FtsK [Nitrospinae bacterium]|nr:DNA translocase FtsK [Nitrospinota bacterium]HBA26200.1 DNA translocase FtsK [Nitrospinota bacterium]
MLSFLKNKIIREIIGVLFIAFALFSFISLISYHSDDPSFSKYISTKIPVKNYGGIVGAYLSDVLVQFMGGGSYFIIIASLLFGWTIFQNEMISLSIFSLIGGILSTTFLCSLIYLLFRTDPFFGKLAPSGGTLGYFITEELIWLFNRGGAYIVVFTLLIFSILLTTRISIGDTLARLNGITGFLLKGLSAIKPKGVKKKEKRVKQPAQKIELVQQPQDINTEPPKIVSTVRNDEEEKEDFEIEGKFASYDTTGEYTLPSLSLLDSPSPTVKKRDEDELINNSSILEKKLIDFGIEGKVVQVLPGPVITMYEFEPASGVKVSRIMSLSDDLALAMKAISVRILAPVPGKSVVGIEIPNVYRDSVSLKELLSSDEFKKAKSKLSLGLGMDISGKPVVTDLAQIPHLLVAGATGSGKSVGINSMICSILFNSTPDEVKMIMIDPKMIELSIYDGIPHLIAPVVTNPKKAANALRWVVEEMERRYNCLAEKGVRNIDGYNRTIEETENKEQKAKDKGQKAKGIRDNTEVQELEEIVKEKEEKKLPYIVVIIDELADLMMVSSKDVEDALTRLAQMARAAGIHLLVATQRPSVDVLTGIIKANFPSRISYQVSSRIDSRTILDSVGAERLLGKGDMLFLPPGTSRLQRIHGAYVSEVEIKKVVEFLKKQQKPIYLESILKPRIDEVAEKEGEDSDELYDQAVALVASTRQASISMIQRRLRIGYNRAARMIEIMEKHGLVGPADGAKPREVYVRDINDSEAINT